MSYHKHRAEAEKELKFGIITVSTSRYEAGKPDDPSGDLANQIIRENGHKVVRRVLVPDSKAKIIEAVLGMLEGVDVVLLIGGTGASKSDITVDILRKIWDKEMPGFGEAFRLEGYKKIGAPALLSRAAMGILEGRPIICLPGSPDGVKLGLEIIIGELPHLRHISKG